jgi:hypothetical protein
VIQDIDLADLERRVISECLANPRSARLAAKHVMGADFLDARLGQMFDLIIGMVVSGTPVDASVVAAEASRRAKASPGGIKWLTFAELASLVALGGSAAVESLASDIRGEAVRRANVSAARARCSGPSRRRMRRSSRRPRSRTSRRSATAAGRRAWARRRWGRCWTAPPSTTGSSRACWSRRTG